MYEFNRNKNNPFEKKLAHFKIFWAQKLTECVSLWAQKLTLWAEILYPELITFRW
jgi:hypothetical protein